MSKNDSLRRKGAVIPLAAVVILLMLGLVAFVIDIGYLNIVRTELQLAADAGAVAGCLALADSPSEARDLAELAAEANNAADSAVEVVPDEDIVFGTWDEDTNEFTPLPSARESEANSVQVTCRRSADRGNPVPLIFARLFGRNGSDVAAGAIALRRLKCGVFIGIESVDLNGNGAYVDSYDSRLGHYSTQTPSDKGGLCSNGSIDVQNGAVYGDAKPGPGHDVTVGSQGDVSGSTDPREELLEVKPVDFGDVATTNDNDQLGSNVYDSGKTSFKHNGGSYHLVGGTYYFTDFSLNGGPITIVEPVTIYVSGDFTAAGSGIINALGNPADLKIFAAGRTVKFSGSSDFAGFVYAPSSDIEVAGGAAFYGGAVGKTLKFHNDNGVHADLGLELLNEMPTRPRLVQ